MTLAGRRSTSQRPKGYREDCFLCEKRASAEEFSAEQLHEPACSLTNHSAL